MEQRARVGLAHLGPVRRRENVRRAMEAVSPALIRALLPHEEAPLQRPWRAVATASRC